MKEAGEEKKSKEEDIAPLNIKGRSKLEEEYPNLGNIPQIFI